MDALAPLKQLKDLQATQRGLGSLPAWILLPWPMDQEEPITSKPQQEEVVDEITAWWQKALGKKAVLGQASSRPPPGQRSPIPKLLWTKPESRCEQQEITVVQATPRPIEERGASKPETQERKGRLWMGRSVTALGRLKHWSGVMVNGAVLFLAVVVLRFAVAVFVTVRAALGLLTAASKGVRRRPRSVRSFVPRNESTTGGE